MGAVGKTKLIGRATLRDHDLRLPDTGPPCKVIENQLEVVDSQPSHGVNRGPSHATATIATVVMFLERVVSAAPIVVPSHDRAVSPASPSTPTTEHVATTLGGGMTRNNQDDSASNTRNTSSFVSPTTMSAGKEQPSSPPLPRSPPLVKRHKEKMQVKVIQAWGLASRAKVLDAVVTVRACGRDAGTTRVSAIGGTTSPEWIDEQ